MPCRFYSLRYFYPRPPRGGRRSTLQRTSASWTFLPTPSARRATVLCRWADFQLYISTHALREEGDRKTGLRSCDWPNFYPRPPRGGRPADTIQLFDKLLISTHALREEGDIHKQGLEAIERRFLPTPSARRATHCGPDGPREGVNFYPRPPRGGRQTAICISGTPAINFYPRPPRGGRPQQDRQHQGGDDFYPRPPRGGRRR